MWAQSGAQRTYRVTVRTVEMSERYTVTVLNGTGSGSYAPGDTVTIVAEAAPTGYQFDGWTVVSGGAVLANQDSVTTTFPMPAEDVTVQASYTLEEEPGDGGGEVDPDPDPGESPGGQPGEGDSYIITASAGQGGSITPSGTVAVPAGGSQSFTIAAETGYEIDQVLVDGISVGSVSGYTFTDVMDNHTITAIFQTESGLADPDDTGVSDWLDTVNHNAYLRGYGEQFAPSANMTRAEVAQMFYNLLLDKDVDITVRFDDVDAGQWYAQAVNTLASLGILEGYGDGVFAPNATITRAEFTAIAMRFTDLWIEGEDIFTDVSPSDWFYAAVLGAVEHGWIEGYGGGIFAPMATITRAEVTAIANRMLGRMADQSYIDANANSLGVRFIDNDPSNWAYYDVVEATNSHTFERVNGKEVWTGIRPTA